MLKNKNCRLSDLNTRQSNQQQQQLRLANTDDAVRPSFVQRLISIIFEHRELPPMPHVYTAVFNAGRENLYIISAFYKESYCSIIRAFTPYVRVRTRIIRT